ncbi:hypothetical protein EB061_00205 [bacterium]|jgi:hypothetical protein|nr:hypothetical protein [bacterium]
MKRFMREKTRTLIVVLVFQLLLPSSFGEAFEPFSLVPARLSPHQDTAHWSDQDPLADRADSLLFATDSVLRSKWGTRLRSAVRDSSSADPDLKQALSIQDGMDQNLRQLTALRDRKRALETRIEKGQLNPEDLRKLEQKIDSLNRQLETSSRENQKLERQKSALFKAKILGAGVAALYLLLQVQGIHDSIQRLKIKEAELLRRQASLVDPATGAPGPDMLQLRALEERWAAAQKTFQNLQRSNSAASEILLAEQRAMDAAAELERCKSNIVKTQQKIADGLLTNQFDARSILRQKVSVGLASAGTLIIGLFGDRIILKVEEWFESENPEKQERKALSYLRAWNAPRVIQSSVLPLLRSKELDPWDKALLFFAGSSELGLKKGVFENALAKYKMEAPSGYAALQRTAEARLKADIIEEFKNHLRNMSIQSRVRWELEHPAQAEHAWIRQNTRDGTRVEQKIMPAGTRRKAKKRSFWSSLFRWL